MTRRLLTFLAVASAAAIVSYGIARLALREPEQCIDWQRSGEVHAPVMGGCQ